MWNTFSQSEGLWLAAVGSWELWSVGQRQHILVCVMGSICRKEEQQGQGKLVTN